MNTDFDGNYITVRISNSNIDALIDTGAVRSLIDDHTARNLKLQVIPHAVRNAKPLLFANGSEVETTGHTLVELYLQGLKVEHRMEVAKSLSPSFILGTDFLSKNQAGIDYAIKPPMFTLFDGLIELPFIHVVLITIALH